MSHPLTQSQLLANLTSTGTVEPYSPMPESLEIKAKRFASNLMSDIARDYLMFNQNKELEELMDKHTFAVYALSAQEYLNQYSYFLQSYYLTVAMLRERPNEDWDTNKNAIAKLIQIDLDNRK